jgi:hypothetical protein
MPVRVRAAHEDMAALRAHRFMYYPLRLFYEAIELGMHTAKNKPLTKKEREEKRKKRREKQLAK